VVELCADDGEEGSEDDEGVCSVSWYCCI